MTPACHTCKRRLREGESAWASDWKVIDPGGVRMETRYTCDACVLEQRVGGSTA